MLNIIAQNDRMAKTLDISVNNCHDGEMENVYEDSDCIDTEGYQSECMNGITAVVKDSTCKARDSGYVEKHKVSTEDPNEGAYDDLDSALCNGEDYVDEEINSSFSSGPGEQDSKHLYDVYLELDDALVSGKLEEEEVFEESSDDSKSEYLYDDNDCSGSDEVAPMRKGKLRRTVTQNWHKSHLKQMTKAGQVYSSVDVAGKKLSKAQLSKFINKGSGQIRQLSDYLKKNVNTINISRSTNDLKESFNRMLDKVKKTIDPEEEEDMADDDDYEWSENEFSDSEDSDDEFLDEDDFDYEQPTEGIPSMPPPPPMRRLPPEPPQAINTDPPPPRPSREKKNEKRSLPPIPHPQLEESDSGEDYEVVSECEQEEYIEIPEEVRPNARPLPPPPLNRQDHIEITQEIYENPDDIPETTKPADRKRMPLPATPGATSFGKDHSTTPIVPLRPKKQLKKTSELMSKQQLPVAPQIPVSKPAVKNDGAKMLDIDTLKITNLRSQLKKTSNSDAPSIEDINNVNNKTPAAAPDKGMVNALKGMFENQEPRRPPLHSNMRTDANQNKVVKPKPTPAVNRNPAARTPSQSSQSSMDSSGDSGSGRFMGTPAARKWPPVNTSPKMNVNVNHTATNNTNTTTEPAQPVRERSHSHRQRPSQRRKRAERPLPPAPVQQEKAELRRYDWYKADVLRDDAFKLLNGRKDGTFLIRDSKKGGPSNPYTLVIFFNSKVWNLHVRKRDDNKYAIGSYKSNESSFTTIPEMVAFHRNHPIFLAGAKQGNVTLTDTA